MIKNELKGEIQTIGKREKAKVATKQLQEKKNYKHIQNSVFVPKVNHARKNIDRVSNIFDLEYMS